MTRLVWNSPEQRRYESGVDRGVLYLDGSGVPWNGLTSVEETSVGGEVEAFYFDGIKYLEKTKPKHFQATITAFSAPKEFAPCVGELPVIPGFILTRQPRKRFGFSYRTLLDNGDDYKIHIIYNATASLSSRGYSTLTESPEPTSLSWTVDAVPPKVSGYRPSAHFTLDTTKTDLFTLRAIEDILYGTATSEPRLPSVEELVDIVGLWEPKLIVPAVEPIEVRSNRFPNPSIETITGWWTRWAPAPAVITQTRESEDPKAGSYFLRSTWTVGGGGDVQTAHTDAGSVSPGEAIRAIVWVRSNAPRSVQLTAWVRNEAMTATLTAAYSGYVQLEPNVWTQLKTPPMIAPAGASRLRAHINGAELGGGIRFNTGEYLDVDGMSFTELDEYFDGDTPDDLEYTYEWTGTPHASTSVRKTRPVAYLTPGLGDLTPSRTPGIYRDLPTTRLAETAVGGLYRLE